MSVHSGLLYYYDLLSLDRNQLRVHYRFDSNSGLTIPNEAPNFPQMSGALSSTGDFYQKSGSGFFTGQSISVQNGTGLSSESWTHLFIFEKTGTDRGVIFDSLMTGALYSGYVFGVNDNNRLYFESYNANGPFTQTSNLMLGRKNAVAIAKTNNLLTFYCYDFNNDEILSDNQVINGIYVLPSSKGIIGRTSGAPIFIDNRPYLGYIDEYVYIQDALTPSTLRYLVSGLCSNYSLQSGAITSFYDTGVTGYLTGVTGVTGVTGYQNVITSSGLDPFGTGEYYFTYATTGLTGFLTTGLLITPLTGVRTYYNTGDSVSVLSIRSGYISEFNLNEVSYLQKIDSDDYSLANIFPFKTAKLNYEAGYEEIDGRFQLNAAYIDSEIEIYLNGVAQISTGYIVTGNFYASGLVLSGDYVIADTFYIDSTGFFSENDVLIYDNISGAKNGVLNISQSGGVAPIDVQKRLVFFNGQALYSGFEYVASGSNFRWVSDKYSGVSGRLFSFPIVYAIESQTGTFITVSGTVPRRNSQMYLNGVRQQINTQYIENSNIDLIKQSGIFEFLPNFVYNNDSGYYE